MIKFTAIALSILVSGCSTAPAFASLAAPNNQMPSQHRGCNPRTDRNGCADKGAPVKLDGVPDIPWCKTGQEPKRDKCRNGNDSGGMRKANKETKCKPVKKTKEFEPPDCGMPDAEQGSGSR